MIHSRIHSRIHSGIHPIIFFSAHFKSHHMIKKLIAVPLRFCLAALLVLCQFAQAATPLNLAGNWRFAIDRENLGIQDKWYAQTLSQQITLPGILQAQGHGDEISSKTPWVLSLYDKNWAERDDYKNYTETGKVKVPFLAQPVRHYLGAAWYQQDITIPKHWRGKRVVLFLERPHWGSSVWLDEKQVSTNLSLVAEHSSDLGMLSPGKHRISIRVDNQMLMAYRPDAHSVSDSLGMSWNGIVGKIELRATSPVWIADAQIYPNVRERSALLKITIGNASGQSGKGILSVKGGTHPVRWNAEGGSAEITVQYAKNTPVWNEFQPALQQLELRLQGRNANDVRQLSFGFAQIKAQGTHFLLNDRPIYFRGTHHGGDFPLTGYPPTDLAYWKKIFQINKDWGINHIRFHSFCPPEAAFQAADEIGIYLQPEPGMWNEVSPGTAMEKMLYEETDRMIKAYGNHPSFLLLSPSNEPKGRWKEAFDKWIAHYRSVDPRRLYTNGTGHTEKEVPKLAEGTDFLVMQRIGQKMLRGNKAWFGKDYGSSLQDIHIPVLSHETGQWVAYPDYDVITKFTGYLRPGNYEIFRDSLNQHGLLAKNKDFAYASGKFQLAVYKEEIEANLRTPGMSGFQLLDLHDYLGQGTALVGLLDAFWEEKSYITAKEFSRFNHQTVPLARLHQRVFKTDEVFSVDAEIAHFGAQPMTQAQAYWKVLDSQGSIVAQDNFATRHLPIAKNIPLGKINLDLSKLAAPSAYKLVIGIHNSAIENDWNFWLYSSEIKAADSKDILITHNWDEAEASLAAGAKVLYMPGKADLSWNSPPLDTLPVFWNRLMNPAWGRMLGLWIDHKHPALAGFPTDAFFDWQWTELVKNTRTINLDRLPPNLQPMVQAIDDWNRNYKLGLIFEAKVSHGKLLVSSIDLDHAPDEKVVAAQLRKSLIAYMASEKFNPKTSISSENFREILFDTRIMKKLGAILSASASIGGDVMNAIDGDPNTFWLAGSQNDALRTPQSLNINFPQTVSMSGLVIMPRQNHRDHEGNVREYAIQVSDDGHHWQDLMRGALVSSFHPQRILFAQNIATKWIKFTALSGFGNDKTTAMAELALLYTGPKLAEENTVLNYKRVKSASADIDEGSNENDRKPVRTVK